jgi:hypothetical protein
MQTPSETFSRLVAALDILLAEEQCVVRSGELEKIRAVQARTDPVVSRLAELRIDPNLTTKDTEPLLPRLAALQARHASSLGIMDARLAEMRAALSALGSARSRLGQLGNTYARKRKTVQQTFSRLSLSA